MKINKLCIAAVVFCMLFASCSKELTEPNNPNSQAGEETYARFTLTLPNEVTKAPDAAAGTTLEKQVNKVGIYVWDAVKQQFHGYVADLAEFDPPVTGPAGTSSLVYTSKFAVKTTVGTKKVVVVVNPEARGTVISTAIDVKKGAILDPVAFGVIMDNFIGAAAANGMVMSGVSDYITLTQVDSLAAVAATPMAVVDVYRNVAKIFLEAGNSMKVNGAQRTTSLGYTVIAKARDSYFLQNGDGSNTLFSTVPGAALTNPSDPYWNNFTAINGFPSTGFEPIKAYNTSALAEATGGFYAFENNPSVVVGGSDARTDRFGNATAFLLRAVLLPDTLITAYDINTGKFTNTYGTGAPVDFYVHQKLGGYWTTAAYTAAIVAGGPNSLLAADFELYTGGVAYYNFRVQDALKDYGVKRNKLYVVQISEISGPGKPQQPNDPTPPYDDITYVKVSATVHPWDVQTSTVSVQ